MKIHASSFGVDMNALLNQLNGHNGLANADAVYKKAMQAVAPKIRQANSNIKQARSDFKNLTTATQSKNIKYVDDNTKRIKGQIEKAHDDLTNFYNNRNYETTTQLNNDYKKLWHHLTIHGQKINNANDMINAVMSNDRQLSSNIAAKIKASNQFMNQVINTDMPQEVQKQMQAARDTFPKNQMMYYPVGQWPSTASPGDICWQSGNFNGQDINAKAYRYNGTSWIPVRTQMDLFASNIFSPNIHGGTITGSQFISQYHGVDGLSNFYVNEKGDIYARNFSMDLKHNNTGNEVNNITYDTEGGTGGMNFNDGMLHMTALASQNTGTLIKDYQGQYEAKTYLEPDYLKLRGVTPSGQVIGRTDLRGGNLEVSDQYNQSWGVRIGYWNDSGGNEGPKIAIENGIQLGYINNRPNLEVGDWNLHAQANDILKISNQYNSGSVEIDAPTNLNGTFLVDGDTVVKGAHYGNDMHRIHHSFDHHQKELNRHDKSLSNHKFRLDNDDTKITTDEKKLALHDRQIDNHNDQLAYHQGWLHRHDKHLSTHDEKLSYHEGWLHQHDNQFNTDEDKLAYDEGTLHQHNTTLNAHQSKLQQHNEELAYHQGWLQRHDWRFGGDESAIGAASNRLDAHDQHLSKHDRHLARHDQDISDLNTAVDRLDITDGTRGNVSFKDLSSGHFTFHNTISILNDHHANNSLSIGGYNGSDTTQLWDDHLFTEQVQTGEIALGESSAALYSTTGGGYLMFNGSTMATRNYVRGQMRNVKSGVSKSTVQSMISSSTAGFATPFDISTAISQIGDGSGPASKDFVRGCIAAHVKARYRK